jgi:hypothetical protein
VSVRAVANPLSGAGGSLPLGYTNSTGTPGNVTNNSPSGRAAFAAASATCVVTNSSVLATSKVLVQLEGAADGTLTQILRVTVSAGSFTVTGNAAATGTPQFSFVVFN